MVIIASAISLSLAGAAIFKLIRLGFQPKIDNDEFEKRLESSFENARKELIGQFGQPFDDFLNFLFTTQSKTRADLLMNAIFENGTTRYSENIFKNLCSHQFDLAKNVSKQKLPGVPPGFSELDKFTASQLSEAILKSYRKACEQAFLSDSEKVLLSSIRDEFNRNFSRLEKISSKIVDILSPFQMITPEFLSKFIDPQNQLFYEGAEPDWWVILNELDFRREITDKIIEKLNMDNSAPTLFCPILGEQKSGKSSLLMRIAYELAVKYGCIVLWQNGYLDDAQKAYKQVKQICAEGDKRVFVFIDNILPSSQAESFLNFLRENHCRATVVGTILSSDVIFPSIQLRLIRNDDGSFFTIKPDDLDLLKNKLEERHLKIILDFAKVLEESRKEKTGVLLNLVCKLTTGESIRESIENKFYKIDQSTRPILAKISIFYKYNILVPEEIVKSWFEDIENYLNFKALLPKQGLIFYQEQPGRYWVLNSMVAKWCLDWYANNQTDQTKLITKAIDKFEENDLNLYILAVYLFSLFYDERKLCIELVDNIQNKFDSIFNNEKPMILATGFGPLFDKLGKVDLATKFYKKALQLDPNDSKIHNNYGALLSKNPSQFSEAEDQYQKALKLDPNLSEVHYNYGNLLANTPTRLIDAEHHFKKAIELNPNYIKCYINYANMLIKHTSRFSDAEKLYREALELNPYDAISHNNYGNLLAKSPSMFDDAAYHFRRAIELNPSYSEAHNNFGNLLANDPKRFSESEKHYQKAIELDPHYSNAHNNYGGLFARSLRFSEAEYHFKIAIQLNPRSSEAHANYGILLMKMGKLESALEHLERALQLGSFTGIVLPLAPFILELRKKLGK